MKLTILKFFIIYICFNIDIFHNLIIFCSDALNKVLKQGVLLYWRFPRKNILLFCSVHRLMQFWLSKNLSPLTALLVMDFSISSFKKKPFLLSTWLETLDLSLHRLIKII